MPLLSDKTMVEDFRQGIIWKDIETVLREEIEDQQKALEVAVTIEQVQRNQATIAALRDLLDLPDRMIEEIDQQSSAKTP